jgi:hypothetical protein
MVASYVACPMLVTPKWLSNSGLMRSNIWKTSGMLLRRSEERINQLTIWIRWVIRSWLTLKIVNKQIISGKAEPGFFLSVFHPIMRRCYPKYHLRSKERQTACVSKVKEDKGTIQFKVPSLFRTRTISVRRHVSRLSVNQWKIQLMW